MNKSLVLVMCDVLVLSAMSLSTGGFESADDDVDYGMDQNSPSDSSMANESEDRIEKLEAALSEMSNALVLVSRDLSEKDRKLLLSTGAVDSLAKELTVAAGKYDRATNEVNALTDQVLGQGQRIRNLEGLLDATSNKLVLISQDLSGQSNVLSQSVVAIADLSNELAVVAGRYASATGAVGIFSNRLVNAEAKSQNLEFLLSSASNGLLLASSDLLNLSNSLRESTISLEALSNNYVTASREYDQATNELSSVRRQLDEEIGSGYVRRRSLIETCKYGLFVKFENARKGEMYYSPLIRIGTNVFVLAYMSRKDVFSIKQMQVMSMNYDSIGTVDSVWGLSGLYDQDIILFKLNASNKMPALSLGKSEGGSRDHYYWFRARGSDVKQAGVMSADAGSSWDEYRRILAGDMLISERGAAVVKMATRKVSALKNEVNFEHVSESDLVRLK